MIGSVPLALVGGPARVLADLVGATAVEVPDVEFDPAWADGPELERWRTDVAAGPKVDCVVVAPWGEAPERSALVDLSPDRWMASMEVPFARWFVALAAGTDRCADDGQVVAVVDRPPAKEAAGWSTVCAVADAVEVMIRSFAMIHQDRRVRVNLVTTPARLPSGPAAELGPVAAAVAMLLDDHRSRVTATVVHLGGH